MTDDILNFFQIDHGLACAGQPKAEEFQLLADEGYRAVINLATEASTGHLPDEPALCAACSLEFTWLPVAWDAPTPADFQAFAQWLAARRKREVKTLVHCAKNWRASLFVFLFRVLEEQADPARAWEDVLEVWEPDGVWLEFARTILASGTDRGFVPPV